MYFEVGNKFKQSLKTWHQLCYSVNVLAISNLYMEDHIMPNYVQSTMCLDNLYRQTVLEAAHISLC